MRVVLTDSDKYCPIEEFKHLFPDVVFSIVRQKPSGTSLGGVKT